MITGLVAVIVLGAAGQWVAWRLRLPSILVLILLGFLVGPVFGLLQPDVLLGPLTLPLVSLAAAVILFEGGLTASWDEIRSVASPVRRLVTAGIAITWLAVAAAAYLFLDFGLDLSLLLGAILVVTGPTVIGPLMRHVRPRGRVGSIAKLEGIINDPIGAVLAILVFRAIRTEQIEHAFTMVATGVLLSATVGALAGFGGARLLVLLLRKQLLPEFLRVSVSVAFVLGAFVIANRLQPESGLLAVTVMGVALASQKQVSVKVIVDFNENLRIVLLPALFIILAARVELEALQRLPVGVVEFVGATIFLIRPLAVFVSTLGSDLTWKERVFLAWMAPRGVVAAAVSSVFGLRLLAEDVEGAELLMPVTFLVIVATVLAYGTTSAPLATALGLRQENARGFLFLGAGQLARMVAAALRDEGYRVLMVDPSWSNVRQARMENLAAEHGPLVSERVLNRIDLNGLGRLIAMSPNDEANSLAAVHFRDVFGANVYQIRPQASGADSHHPMHLRGHYFPASHRELSERLYEGGHIKVTLLTEEFDFEDFREHHGPDALPLFSIDAEGNLRVMGEEPETVPEPGEKLVSMVVGHRGA
ncbi:MAG: cation:proton antiporter [Myxococcota bacterium]